MEPFKKRISPELVQTVGRVLAREVPGVDADAFAGPVVADLAGLELKQRVQRITAALVGALPADAAERHAALVRMLHPQVLGEGDGFEPPSDDRGVRGWGIWPMSMVVAEHGLDDFEGGLAALREMTRRSTSEFAVRHFLIARPEATLRTMLGWAGDTCEHVRRLASEGSRPRLPWGLRLRGLVADPAPTRPILDALKDDPSEYVRRSVANHLNDVAKDHPGYVLDCLEAWRGKAPDRLIGHAARTLIKAGNPRALALIGLDRFAGDVSPPNLSAAEARMGDTLTIQTCLVSAADRVQAVQVDYVLELPGREAGRCSVRVFKGRRVEVPPRGTSEVTLRHRFREVTTRRHYPGACRVLLRVNGTDTPAVVFTLA